MELVYVLFVCCELNFTLIWMFALSGDSSTLAGIQREAGMLRAVAESEHVGLVRVIPVNWNEETAYERARDLLSHSSFDAIWAANDAIAIGAQRAATEMGHAPGHDVSFVGLNWSLRGMHEVRKGTLTMSHGGHFLAGAWAIVILNDHFKGAATDRAPMDIHFKMSPITPDNVDLYLERLGDRNWDKIDFAGFSKTATGSSDYDFSATAVLEAAASVK